MASHTLYINNTITYVKHAFDGELKSDFTFKNNAYSPLGVYYSANYYTPPYQAFPYLAKITTNVPTRLAMWIDGAHIKVVSTVSCVLSITSLSGLNNGYSASFDFDGIHRPASAIEMFSGTSSTNITNARTYGGSILYGIYNNNSISYHTLEESINVDDAWTSVANTNINRVFDIDIPLFDSYENACDFLVNRTTTGALNVLSLEDKIDTMTRYYVNNNVKINGVTADLLTKSHSFSIQAESKIYLVATEHSTSGVEHNMQLFINKTPFYLMDGETPLKLSVITDELGAYYYGEWQDYDNGNHYNSYVTTNIPIFDNIQDGMDYSDGLTDGSKSLNGVGGGKISTIGEKLDKTEIETSTFDMSLSGSKVWALNGGDMVSLNNFIYNNANKTHLLDGLWLYGDNPSNALISIFYIPFDISNFYTLGNIVHIPFGTYLDDEISPIGRRCNVGGKSITICNTLISPTYNDYRDYTQFKYELKLPFMPMITLNHNNYLGTRLKVDMYFDAPSRTVKYVCYADDKIVDTFECGVGVNMPYSTSDTYNKMLENANNLIHLGGDAVSMNPLNFAVDTVKTGVNFIKEPKYSVNGSFSTGVNTYDVRYAYMRITEYETLKPSDLNTVYNYPSYYVGKADSLIGYCELADIKFDSFNGTQTELNTLKTLVKSGVIF